MTISFFVKNRNKKVSSELLRKEGYIPAVVYGPKQEALSLSVDRKEFIKMFKQAGESTIIELSGLDEKLEALVHEVDFHPLTGEIRHVDFYAFERGKDMTTEVPVEFVGQSQIEKIGGMVNKVMHEVLVTCRPSKLPASISVDVSTLAEPDQQILVKDLPELEGVVYEDDKDEVVAVAQGVRSNEDEQVTESFDPNNVEVVNKGKVETGDV